MKLRNAVGLSLLIGAGYLAGTQQNKTEETPSISNAKIEKILSVTEDRVDAYQNYINYLESHSTRLHEQYQLAADIAGSSVSVIGALELDMLKDERKEEYLRTVAPKLEELLTKYDNLKSHMDEE